MGKPGDPVDDAGYYPDGTRAYPNGGDPGYHPDGTPITAAEVAAAEAAHQAKFGNSGAKDGPNVGNTQGTSPQQKGGPGGQVALTVLGGLAPYEQQKRDTAAMNNHFNYGGVEGGAQASTNYFNGLGIGAENRKGVAIDYTNADADRGLGLGARASQLSVAEMMRKRAAGEVPSISEMQAQRDAGRLVADQSSIAAGARGPAALALAQQQSAANSANGISGISQQAQIAAAQERERAEQGALGAFTTVRGGDTALQGLDANMSQSQAALDAKQRELNDAYSNANYNRGVAIQEAQLGAQGRQVAIAAGAEQAAAARAQAAGFHSDDRFDRYAVPIIGGALGAGAIGLGALFHGDGSDASDGKPHGGYIPGGGAPMGEDGAPPSGLPTDPNNDPNNPGDLYTQSYNTPMGGGSFGLGGPKYGAAAGAASKPAYDYNFRPATTPVAVAPKAALYAFKPAPMAAPAQISTGTRPNTIGSPATVAPVGKPKPDPYAMAAREDGGPIEAGHPYLVGERGPELVVPARSGRVVTAEQTRAMLDRRHPLMGGVTHRSPYDGDGGPEGDIESLGPSGARNREEPDYNFIYSPSPLNVAEAERAHPGAIPPKTRDYMRREGMWGPKHDAILSRQDEAPTLRSAMAGMGRLDQRMNHKPGVVEEGNINHQGRPEIRNPDGTVSTVRSMSFNDGPGREVLIPTAYGGAVHSDDEAIANYRATGQHMGVFSTPDQATAHAQRVHDDYAAGKYASSTESPAQHNARRLDSGVQDAFDRMKAGSERGYAALVQHGGAVGPGNGNTAMDAVLGAQRGVQTLAGGPVIDHSKVIAAYDAPPPQRVAVATPRREGIVYPGEREEHPLMRKVSTPDEETVAYNYGGR